MSISVARLLSELRGGVALWQGYPWWFVLPETLRVANPGQTALWLLGEEEQPPERIARWLGELRCFPVDSLCLAQWKMELLRAGLTIELLPRPAALLREGQRLPRRWDIPAGHAVLAQRLWQRLAPLLGTERATSVLEFLRLGWTGDKQRVAYPKDAFARLLALLRNDRTMRQGWVGGSCEQRAELFAGWMGPGRCDVETLAQFGWGEWQQTLDTMRAVWCEPEIPLHEPLSLGLVFPGARAPATLAPEKLSDLLVTVERTPELTLQRFQSMLDTITVTNAPAHLLAHTVLACARTIPRTEPGCGSSSGRGFAPPAGWISGRPTLPLTGNMSNWWRKAIPPRF